ncbi:MAG: Fic family protein, partial [Alphaproteobacteria bacterium]
MKEDKKAAEDRGETVAFMEPMLITGSAKSREELADLALEPTALSTGLRRSLPEGIVSALSDLVRSMNCYYSNLIEGHYIHSVDIERALNEDYSQDPKKRDLQREAITHVKVQTWIDRDGLFGQATSATGILEVHRRFSELLPDDLLWSENPNTNGHTKIIPCELRRLDVQVGRHIAVSAGALPRFMNRFEEAYKKLGKVDSIIATATAHHRLLWMHPFLDGNGRVARLMSYSMLRDA